MQDKIRRDEVVAAYAAMTAGWGATDQVALFTNDITIDPQGAVSQFTEPTDAWYNPGTKLAVYGEPYLDPTTGRLVIPVSSVQYNWASPGTSNTVRGYFIKNAAGTQWRMAKKFDVPVVLDDALDSLIVQPGIERPVQYP